jgi:hypothetical protein
MEMKNGIKKLCATMEMFKLDRRQAVALTLAVLVGVIGGIVVGFLMYSGAGGTRSLGSWITKVPSNAWHGSFFKRLRWCICCRGAFLHPHTDG